MKIFFFLFLILIFSAATNYGNNSSEVIDLGKFSPASLNKIINEGRETGSRGRNVEIISENFLGVPYVGHTLIGSFNEPEILTINLAGMDCFTYIDYVEALRSSSDFSNFSDHVRTLRYKKGEVDYSTRNHFFSDWPIYNSDYVKDVTGSIGSINAKTVVKNLNLKSDGTKFLEGIPVIKREINYIPSEYLTQEIITKINTGDYIGIYSNIQGLDVTHTGIVIKKNGKAYIRHASSRKATGKVVDEDLLIYMKNKPGIVIYRTI